MAIEQRTSPERRDTTRAPYGGNPAILALIDAAEDLAGEWATVARLRALLRRCEPFLGGYQCEGQTERDELSALEADIAAELGPEREGAGE